MGEYFTESHPDPFMIKVYPVRPEKRDAIPAVTHVDGTGRLQSVSKTQNSRYWALINSLGEKTGVPVVLNTSFNENEPIVNTPTEALNCFLRTKMHRIVMENVTVARKAEQPMWSAQAQLAPFLAGAQLPRSLCTTRHRAALLT